MMEKLRMFATGTLASLSLPLSTPSTVPLLFSEEEEEEEEGSLGILLAGFASIVLPVARILNPKLGLGLFWTTTHLRFHSRKQNPPSVKAPKTSEDARSHLFLLLLLQKQ
jgi:hypothetical protein